jgi:hypothetical protein
MNRCNTSSPTDHAFTGDPEFKALEKEIKRATT